MQSAHIKVKQIKYWKMLKLCQKKLSNPTFSHFAIFLMFSHSSCNLQYFANKILYSSSVILGASFVHSFKQTLSSVHSCPLSTVQCQVLYNVHTTQSNAQCTLSTVHCPLSAVQCPLSIFPCPLYIQSTVHCSLSTVKLKSYIKMNKS